MNNNELKTTSNVPTNETGCKSKDALDSQIDELISKLQEIKKFESYWQVREGVLIAAILFGILEPPKILKGKKKRR
jgi:hypothetical protein